jgi:hypothetical protein
VEDGLPGMYVDVHWWRKGERERIDCITDTEHPEDYFTHWQSLPAPPTGDAPTRTAIETLLEDVDALLDWAAKSNNWGDLFEEVAMSRSWVKDSVVE